MTFQPVLPLGGYAGWRFLQSSLEAQQQQFSKSPAQALDRDYFRENIANVQSAEDLVSDYRLLRVALSAYGLQDDLPNRAFIERVLSDGVDADDALANRLADKSYRKFSEAFGFGSALPPRTQFPGFADRVLARFDQSEFERAIGEQDDNMRLALNASRELPEIAQEGFSDDTAWFTVLGNPPLRAVFETALALPAGVGALDLDQQVFEFRKGAERVLGNSEVSQFSEPQAVEDLMRSFTLQAQIAAGPSSFTPGATALVLLQNL